jgi:hypothetical protein
MGKLQIILQAINILVPGVILTIWIYLSGKKDNTTTKTTACLTDLFPEYKKTMSNINKATEEAEKLYDNLMKGGFSNFNEFYYTDEYKNFRETGYFFELIGTMVRRNEIQAESVVHCFSFPIEFFRRTKKIRDIISGKNYLPDYWNNFCYLCALYNAAKKFIIGGWIVNGEIIVLSESEMEELPPVDKKRVGFWRRSKSVLSGIKNKRN